MKRGDLVTVALQGDYGKPRPALVIRADNFNWMASVSVLPLTSTFAENYDFRPTIFPNPENGLRNSSQVSVDKPMTVNVNRVGAIIGQIGNEDMLVVESMLALYLGFSM